MTPATGLGRRPSGKINFGAGCASVLLLLLAPFLAVLGLWVAFESQGPVTVQRAIARRDGQLIYVTEYRVWRVPSDASEPARATIVGRVLLATGLRRLPRLLDIKAGRLTFADLLTG